MGKQTIFLPEMPKDAIIITKDMIIIGTGEKYTPREVRQYEGLLSQAK